VQPAGTGSAYGLALVPASGGEGVGPASPREAQSPVAGTVREHVYNGPEP